MIIRVIGVLAALALLGASVLVSRPAQPAIQSIPAGRGPAALLLDGPGARAVVANDGDGTVSLLDLARGRVRRTVPVGDPRTLAPLALALDPVTHHLFVASRTDTPTPGVVQMLDGRSGARLASVPVGHEASALAVDARHGHVLVANETDGTLSLLHARSGALLRTVALGLLPLAVAVDARSGHAFVIGPIQSGGAALPAWGDGEVVGLLGVLDTRSGMLLRRIPLGSEPSALAVDSSSARIFVACAGDDTVRVLDTRSGAPVHTVTLEAAPTALAVDARRGLAYVVSAAGILHLLDARTGRLLRTLRIDPFASVAAALPNAVAVDEARDRVYLSTYGPLAPGWSVLTPQGHGLLYVLDARTGAPRRRIAVGVAPQAVAVEEDSGRVVVANGGGLVIRTSYGWGEPWLGRLHAWLPWLDRGASPPATERVLGSVSLIDGAQ